MESNLLSSIDGSSRAVVGRAANLETQVCIQMSYPVFLELTWCNKRIKKTRFRGTPDLIPYPRLESGNHFTEIGGGYTVLCPSF